MPQPRAKLLLMLARPQLRLGTRGLKEVPFPVSSELPSFVPAAKVDGSNVRYVLA